LSKFSYILLGLIVTFSSFVLFTVHLGSSQAFVKAQTIIGVDLGNGFPGTSLTDSFTIANAQNDTANYTLSLEAPNTTGVIDIRPYLTIWKDPVETDFDGPITGYSGPGNFTAGTDTEDTWFVTFSVPDVTLPQGTVLEYDCRIVIDPVVP
jgi:hypothetical protein